MTIADSLRAEPAFQADAVAATVRRRSWAALAGLAAVVLYLAYAWHAFGVSALIATAQPDRAVLLGLDSVAHKVHVTKDLRAGDLQVSIEGERTAVYQQPPAWVATDGGRTTVDLGDGYTVAIDDRGALFEVPGYGTIAVRIEGGKVVTDLPGPAPYWLQLNPAKFDARPTIGRRLQVSRTRIEVHRYFFGWENFFFPFRSELTAYSAGEIAALAVSGDRLSAEIPNWRYILDTFLTNPDWLHGEVLIALFETIMMAVLGTLIAAFVGLPLAFLAATNFTPSRVLQAATRRLFDFLRGIDMLIWSLIFIRAFGIGPLTGALAIAFTDTGSLGKLFSEALENIDDKQVDGVRATGASRLQRYRFGVIPQILPVLVSQILYYLKSNTRSATVIGALGAGGIGLLLVETMRTAKDWENTTYIIILTILVVFAMDSLSRRLRRRLIDG